MIWNERTIARAIARQTFQRKYLCVVPNCMWTGHECDLLAVTENLRIIDVEIKISRGDLKADAAKEKWWLQPQFWGRMEVRPSATPRQWPPKVWKHYYALPREIWSPDLLAALRRKASQESRNRGVGSPKTSEISELLIAVAVPIMRNHVPGTAGDAH